MSGRLAGKVCFITGTAGGQGAAAAELFAAEGAAVVGCDIKLDGIDLSDPAQATGWIERGVASEGRIDVLYNNASATRVGPFDELTWEDWQFVLRNELDQIFTVSKAARPHLKADGGVVINTASVSAWRPSHPMHEMARTHPLGRLGEPIDVARVALFLASADAAYLNAVDIVVDGGQSAIV